MSARRAAAALLPLPGGVPRVSRRAVATDTEDVVAKLRERRLSRRKMSTTTPETGASKQTAKIVASAQAVEEVVSIIQSECPSYAGKVTPATTVAELKEGSDSLDTLEAMMELEDRFKVELEDEWMEQVITVQDLADLIYRTPRGLKLRTVDDATYIAMIRKSHAENRWGELDNLEDNIPPQYEHKGPSLAEQEGAVPPGTSWPE